MDPLGILVELQSLARVNLLHSLDCHAQQNQNYRKHNLSLRGMFGTLQVLLYSQLVRNFELLIFPCRMYRFYVDNFYCWTQILSGLLQTGLYVDFLYYYFVSLKEGKKFTELPV